MEKQRIGRRWNAQARAALLAASVALCLLGGLAIHNAQQAQAVNLHEDCTLTAIMPGKDIPQYADMPEAPELVYDIYKVADAKAMEGFDAYSFAPTEALRALDPESADKLAAKGSSGKPQSLTASDYLAMAQSIATKALGEGGTLEAPAKGIALGEPTDVDAGLYLLVVRGKNLTDYTKTISVDGADTLVTIGNGPLYSFSFLPELVAVPVRSDGQQPDAANSADGTVNWQYNVAATMKPSWEPRFGSLDIVKTLASMDTAQPASFVFQVDAWDGDAAGEGNLVYSNVVPIDFSQAGQQTVTVDGIPAGSWVRVTEVYSGASYTPATPVVEPDQPIDADAALSVSFENTYEPTGANGGSVVNTFTYDQGEWAWEQTIEEGGR